MGGMGGGQLLSPPPGLLGQSKPMLSGFDRVLDIAADRPFLGTSVGLGTKSLENDSFANSGRNLFNLRASSEQPLQPIASPTNIVGRSVRVVDSADTVEHPPLLKAKSLTRLPPGLLSPLDISEGSIKVPRRKLQVGMHNSNTSTAEDDSDDRSLSDQFLANEMAESVLFGSPFFHNGGGSNSTKSIGQRLNSLNRMPSQQSLDYSDNVSGRYYTANGFDDDALSDGGDNANSYQLRQSYQSSNNSRNSRLINGAYGNQSNLHPHTDIDNAYE